MIEWLDIITIFFQNSKLLTGISYLFAFLFVKELVKKDRLNKKNKEWIIIFSLVSSIILFTLFKLMIRSILDVYYLLENFSLPDELVSGDITGVYFLFMIITFFTLELFIKKRQSFIKNIIYINYLFLFFSVLGILLAIASYFSSFKPLTLDLLGKSTSATILAISMTVLIIIRSKGRNKINEFERLIKSIQFKTYLMIFLISCLFVLALNQLYFPKIVYGEEQLNYYVADLNHGVFDETPVRLYEHTIQPVKIERVGKIDTLFFENKANVTFFDKSLMDVMSEYYGPGTTSGLLLAAPHENAPDVRITTNHMTSGLISIGILNISPSTEYNGFVLKFENLNKSWLTEANISGYRKSDKKGFVFFREELSNKSLIKIHAINTLDAPVLVGKERNYLADYPITNETCLIYNPLFELYNTTSNEKIGKYFPQQGLNEFYAYDSPELKNIVIQLQIYERKVLDLDMLYIPPHTNLTVSFDIVCN